MTLYNFSCIFDVKSSHNISNIGFSGNSKFIIENEVNCHCPFGFQNTTIAINKNTDNNYKLTIKSYELNEQLNQIKYLSELSCFLSFLIGKDESNGRYGTPFIDLKLETFLCNEEFIKNHKLHQNNKIIINDYLNIRDTLSIEATRHFKFENKSFIGAFNHEIIHIYHNGLKAESEKSKFFHWFLILEFLENTPLYSNLFPKGSMFNDEETKKIKTLANTFSSDKKGIVLSLLSRTSEYRGTKLFELLTKINIVNISTMQGKEEISINTIKEIISSRNKLFHRSSEFPTTTLWFKLFPIVTAVVEQIIYNKQCIEVSS